MHLVHQPDFHIELENDHIILHGTAEESGGVILRGAVILNCSEMTKVKAITLRFIGKVRVNWLEGKTAGTGSTQSHHREERTLITHEWSFLKHNRKIYHLPEGHYKWDFELPLPGDLPESISYEQGEVFYKLRATVERPTFSLNYKDKKDLHVSRLLLPSSLALTQSLIVSNEWANKLTYDISVPSKLYALGTMIPITFLFVPLTEHLQIRMVSCMLKEYITLSTSNHSRVEGKIIQHITDSHFASEEDPWSKTELLPIPDAVKTDSSGDLIKIRHKVKIIVSIRNYDGHISELRAAIPVIISEFSPDEDVNILPAYEDAWKSAPYDPQQVADLVARGDLPRSLALASPNAAAIGAGNAFSFSDTEEDLDSGPQSSSTADTSNSSYSSLPWQRFDLNRVPSYTTAIRSNRLYSFGSLPAYENAVAIPGRTDITFNK
ncbi:hypothetical protein BDB01DRAFT_760426 [Pilobolus umbonatus]|nr:hypothetical protein BDB01DRAFT_760426 [Pilobolus umbonatus]